MFNCVSLVQPLCAVYQHRWFLHLSVFGGLLRQRTHLLAQESPTVQGSHVLQLQTLQEDQASKTFILEPPFTILHHSDKENIQTTGNNSKKGGEKTCEESWGYFHTHTQQAINSSNVKHFLKQLETLWPLSLLFSPPPQQSRALNTVSTAGYLFVVCWRNLSFNKFACVAQPKWTVMTERFFLTPASLVSQKTPPLSLCVCTLPDKRLGRRKKHCLYMISYLLQTPISVRSPLKKKKAVLLEYIRICW